MESQVAIVDLTEQIERLFQKRKLAQMQAHRVENVLCNVLCSHSGSVRDIVTMGEVSN